MKKTKSLEPSQRQLRVGEEIRHILADIFMRGDFYAEGLQGISVTVSEVDVAPDMRNATVYVSSLGGAVDEGTVSEVLNAHAQEFNHTLAKKLVMKFTPRLAFAPDRRFEYVDKIEKLLKKTQE